MIRVFVGCAPNHEDAESQAVLEYTLRQYASQDVDITWMKLSHSGPFSGWNSQDWATPFTGFRWALPALCNYEGRAVYVDSDFIFRADIVDLFYQPIPGHVLAKGHGGRLCLSLWDCAKCRFMPGIDELRAARNANTLGRARLQKHGVVTPFSGSWNCLDNELNRYGDKLNHRDIKAIHYTAMRHQPHLLKYAIPRLKALGRSHWFDGEVKPHWHTGLQQLFDRLLVSAAKAGYTVERYCQDPIYGEYTKRSVAAVKDFSRTKQ